MFYFSLTPQNYLLKLEDRNLNSEQFRDNDNVFHNSIAVPGEQNER